MKTKLKLITSSILLGSALGAVAPAYAQETILEEIVVTAQKREQNIRDVAATINVVSGSKLDEYSILNFEDLERITSGLSLSKPNPRNTSISLRGVVVDPESGTGSAVDVYQNDVPQRSDNIFGALYDMERVEVLRGPQGSVQGATSPAGAIIVHTAKPDLEKTSGYVQANYGSGNRAFNLQGAVSVPLIKDKLALRVAAYDDQNDGNNIINRDTGNVQGSDTTSYRLSMRWMPTENIELNLTHQNNDSTVLGTPGLMGTRAGASAFGGIFGIPCQFAGGNAGESCTTLTAEDKAALARDDSFTTQDIDLTTLNLDWNIGENHKVSYVYGKTESSKVSRTENDRSNNVDMATFFLSLGLGVTNDTDYLTHQSTTTDVDADVHEIRFQSVDNERWNYMFGFFKRDQDTSTKFQSWNAGSRYIPLAIFNNPFIPVTFTGGHIEGINFATGGVIPFNSETEAFFTAHEFKISDATTINAALRYQEIDRFNTTNILFDGFNQPERISIQNLTATSSVLPPAFVGPTAAFIAGSILQGSILDAIASTNIESIAPEFQNPSSDSTTGSLSVTHDWSDAWTTYFAYQRSFRGGGISVTPGSAISAQDLLYGDEESDSFEIGSKSVHLNGALELNVALFNQTFDGYQVFTRNLDYVAPNGQVLALTGGLVSNADAKFTGIDMDWRAVAGDNWQFGGSLSYVKAEFDNASIPCNIRQPGQVIGRCQSNSRIPGAPELSANFFAEYARPAGEVELFARTNAKYNGGIVATRAVEFGQDPGETDSFVLVDVFLGVRQENWEAALWVKNLTDDDSDLDLFTAGARDDFDVNNDFTQFRRQQERSVGFQARLRF